MRVFALSDIHVDYEVNARWVSGLSLIDYQQDVLILAGDVSDSIQRLEHCLHAFTNRFRRVFFVPGNHDLWVIRDQGQINSLDKFNMIKVVAERCGVSMKAEVIGEVEIIPLLGWYDNSFGVPEPELLDVWMDFRACRWPEGWVGSDITNHFVGLNDAYDIAKGDVRISFSHFLPRIDVMPAFIPQAMRKIYPILGSSRLEQLVRDIRPDIHVYGHSHVNRDVTIDGINYINNAFAYPHEQVIAAKALRCIYRSDA
jgi:predicted phosphodiesterase